MNKQISEELLEVIPRIMDCVRNEMRKPFKNYLTIPQFRVINYINKNAFISNHELAGWMGVTSATLTRMIDILSAKRLLKRKASLFDKRKISFIVTPIGARIVKFHRSRNLRYFEKRFHSLTKQEAETILEAMLILKKVF